MQVIVSACFSLYTYESNSSIAQPVATSIANNSLFSHKQKSFQLQLTTLQPQLTVPSISTNTQFNRHYINLTPPKHLIAHPFRPHFIIRAITFRSINALTALKRSQTTQHSQYYLFAYRRKIKGQKQDLSSHSRPSYFIKSPKQVLFRYAFLFLAMQMHPVKQSESNKTPISFSSKYIDQSFYIDASPPYLCVVPFSNRYTSQQEPHRF